MSGEIRRGLQLGRLALDMIRIRRQQQAGAVRQALIERLGYLRGLPQKMAQLLASTELSAPLLPATETENALPFAQVQLLLENALRQPLDSLFAEFEPEGRSASLGQVHRARLHDGRQVAVKIQYPGIYDALSLDLKALNLLSAPIGGFKKGFDQQAYQREVQQMLMLELDYAHEAAMLGRFRDLLQHRPGIEIPEVIESHSNSEILTMSWLAGESFEVVHHWPEQARSQLADQLLAWFTTSAFGWGLLHGDPHPGNYRFRLEQGQPVLGVLDFGCIKQIPERVRVGFRKLLKALLSEELDQETATALYLQMGFNPDFLLPISHKLPAVSQVLFGPFLAAEPQRVQDWRLGERMSEVLGEDRWNFRFAGPAGLLFFIRAYQGLIQYLKGLELEVHWRPHLEAVLGLLPAALSEASPSQARPVTVPVTVAANEVPLAKHVRIRLLEAGQTRVALTFPIATLVHLPDLIPEEFASSLVERGIDIRQICEQARLDGPKPGSLFEDRQAQQALQVWLE